MAPLECFVCVCGWAPSSRLFLPALLGDSGPGGYAWAYVGMFVITGMYSAILFPAVTGLTGVVLERLAPRWVKQVDWVVTAVLALIPVVALFVAFG